MNHMNKVAQGLIDMAKRIESLDTANADLRARLEAAEKARDEKAEAVKIIARNYWSCVSDQCVGSDEQIWADDVSDDIKNNPTAAAAVKEASE